MKRKSAFTLAEILVVLAIIGIVATLTLPGLLMSYRDKTYISQLQRTYNLISNAAAAQMLEDDVDDLSKSTITTANGVGDFIKKNLKVSNDCSYGNEKDYCFADKYFNFEKAATTKTISKVSELSKYNKFSKNTRCFLLNTGATICMQPMNENKQGYAGIIIDTNGQAGPNVNGLDLFRMSMDKDGNVVRNPDDSCTVPSGWNTCFLNYIRKTGWKMYK